MSDLGMSGLLLAQAGETVPVGPSGWLMLLVLVAIFLVPILLGNLVARLLKLKDLAGRLSVVFFALTMGIAPFAWHFTMVRVEARQYDAALTEWESKASRKSNNVAPDDRGTKDLESVLPNLQIKYSASSPTADRKQPEISTDSE
jgi:hypothetical protein